MKQYIALLSVLLTVIFTSCSNEDIEIINSSNLKINITTQSVYDDFECSEPFKNRFLGGKGYSIGVYSFIYDEKGKLTSSDSTFVDTFQRITQEFKTLNKGNYTLITLEMLVENDNNYASPNWVIIDKESLETIKIVNKNYTSYWYSAVGLYTSSLSIDSSQDLEKNVNPKGIGTIIKNEITNFDVSKYACVEFFTKDQPKGRLLSPSYDGEDRFVYDHYNESNTWTARGYNYNKSGLSSDIAFDVYLLEEGLIRYCFGALSLNSDGNLDSSFYPCPSKNSTFTVRDGSIFYGGYHYIGGPEGQDCVAALFNSSNEYDNWYKSYLETYVKPYLVWGASANDVDAYMTKSGMKLDDFGFVEESSMYWSYYCNSSNTVFYEYQFDLNKNNLNTVFMNFDDDYFTISSIESDLTKTFGQGQYSADLSGYIFESNTTLLLLSTDTSDGFITILYIPNANTRSIPELSRIKRMTPVKK